MKYGKGCTTLFTKKQQDYRWRRYNGELYDVVDIMLVLSKIEGCNGSGAYG